MPGCRPARKVNRRRSRRSMQMRGARKRDPNPAGNLSDLETPADDGAKWQAPNLTQGLPGVGVMPQQGDDAEQHRRCAKDDPADPANGLNKSYRTTHPPAAGVRYNHWCHAKTGRFEADFLEVQVEEPLQASLECSGRRPDGDRTYYAMRIKNHRSSGIGAYGSEPGRRRMRKVRRENGADGLELSRRPIGNWPFRVVQLLICQPRLCITKPP